MAGSGAELRVELIELKGFLKESLNTILKNSYEHGGTIKDLNDKLGQFGEKLVGSDYLDNVASVSQFSTSQELAAEVKQAVRDMTVVQNGSWEQFSRQIDHRFDFLLSKLEQQEQTLLHKMTGMNEAVVKKLELQEQICMQKIAGISEAVIKKLDDVVSQFRAQAELRDQSVNMVHQCQGCRSNQTCGSLQSTDCLTTRDVEMGSDADSDTASTQTSAAPSAEPANQQEQQEGGGEDDAAGLAPGDSLVVIKLEGVDDVEDLSYHAYQLESETAFMPTLSPQMSEPPMLMGEQNESSPNDAQEEDDATITDRLEQRDLLFTHSETTNIQFDLCEVCNQLVKTTLIKKHAMRHKRSGDRASGSSASSTPQKQDKVRCPLCDRSVLKSKMTEHIRSHTENAFAAPARALRQRPKFNYLSIGRNSISRSLTSAAVANALVTVRKEPGLMHDEGEACSICGERVSGDAALLSHLHVKHGYTGEKQRPGRPRSSGSSAAGALTSRTRSTERISVSSDSEPGTSMTGGAEERVIA